MKGVPVLWVVVPQIWRISAAVGGSGDTMRWMRFVRSDVYLPGWMGRLGSWWGVRVAMEWRRQPSW